MKHSEPYPSYIQIRRAYVDPDPGDGYRVLVDRLWPRGRSKDVLKLDAWLPEISPSTALRKWYHQAPDEWDAFREKYEAELAQPEQQQRLGELLAAAGRQTLTLVYGARDPDRNHALVLLDALERVRRA